MAISPRFSFSGWTSQSLAPKINPASVPVQTPGLQPPAAPGQLVAQTSAANSNLPAWLQQEVARINAQDALRTQLAGQVAGGGTQSIDIGSLLRGQAALTQAQTGANLYQDQRALNNQIQEQMRRRAGLNQGLGAPGLYDLSGARALDTQLNYLQTGAAPMGARTLSAFGTAPRSSGWISPMGGFF